VDSVVVDWPAGGRTVVTSPPLNGVLEVLEEGQVPVLPPAERLPVRVAAPFPNPFASAVTVGFSLAEPGPVRIEVYDLQGRPVRKLLDRILEAGDHVAGWDGEDDLGRRLPPGMYFYRLEAGRTVVVKKLVRF
jgi:hypothetical protein